MVTHRCPCAVQESLHDIHFGIPVPASHHPGTRTLAGRLGLGRGLDRRDLDRTDRTLSEQADAIQAAVIQTGGDVVLVGHSGANGPVSIAMDRHPELIRRVVWVDSGPMSDGTAFAPDLPPSVMELPLPRVSAVSTSLVSEHEPFQNLLQWPVKPSP